MLSKVVFPAPLAPIMAVTRPDLKIPLIPFKICLSMNDFLNGILDLAFWSLILTE